MSSKLRAGIFFVAAIGAVAGVSAASSFSPIVGNENVNAHADSIAVAAVVNGFHKALSNADSAAALAALSSDAVILESGGVETRSEYRSHHLSGDIAFAKAVRSERGPLQVTVEGNTAWTRSTSTVEGSFSGRQINSLGAESMVLTRSGGTWKIRSIHWSSRNKRPAK